jgi:hypothetical protein
MAVNFLVRRIGDLILIVQNTETPSRQEWEGFLRLLSEMKAQLSKCKILIMTEGGGPDADQRKRLQMTLERTPVRVAVVSDNLKVRFVASTIALFHRQHRAFGKLELPQAYEHLGMTLEDRRIAQDAIPKMIGELG